MLAEHLVRNQIVLVWYGMVEVCEGTPVAVGGWVLTVRHDQRHVQLIVCIG